MEGSKERDWAAAHYRVERESTGVKASKRKLKRIAEDALRHGGPAPEEAHDVIRIYDREGNVVWEKDWGNNREAAIADEARIVEDLLALDVVAFRARHGVPLPTAEGNDAAPSQPVADPWAPEPEGNPDRASG